VLNDFKEFVAKGNVMDMAVGVIMGAAFGKIVTTFTDGILMPPIGLILGGINFNDKFINLSDKAYDTLDAARKAGAPIITYGTLITNVIDFLIVAFVLFLLVKQVNRLKKSPPPVPAAPPPATPDQKLLTEIRDLLAKK
jgi:large conductance mechanosensitive channel